MSSAARHTFTTQDPVDRFSEMVRFYVELRGKDYHPALPVPRTLVSDCRQLVQQWVPALTEALPILSRGIATAWKAIIRQWETAVERLEATPLGPNEVYDDNQGFWLALRRLALQLGAVDQVITRRDVLVWAVKDTVREHAKSVQQAGRAAAQAAQRAASAIPTLAKALAAGALGLGIYAIARRT